MKKTILTAVFVIAATMSFAQKVQVVTTTGKTYTYDISENDQVTFVPAEAAIEPAEGVVEVDLGLSSGTKWANMNIGASSVTDCGAYFMWGYTEDCSNIECKDANCDTFNEDIAAWQGDTKYDAAAKNWGDGWVTPTTTQVKELYDECDREWTSQTDADGNAINGIKFMKKEDNSVYIFLPAGGYRNDSKVDEKGNLSVYWTCSPRSDGSKNAANAFKFGTSINLYEEYGDRHTAIPIRPVKNSAE